MRFPDRGKLLLAIPFVLLGLWCIVGWAQHSKLRCDRTRPGANCSLVSASLIRHDAYHFRADDLIGTRIETRVRTDGDGNTTEERRVILLLQGEDRPLNTFGESGSGELEATVNAYVADPGLPTLELDADNRWFAWPTGIVILVFGVWMLRMD